jgi:hypothetical protein
VSAPVRCEEHESVRDIEHRLSFRVRRRLTAMIEDDDGKRSGALWPIEISVKRQRAAWKRHDLPSARRHAYTARTGKRFRVRLRRMAWRAARNEESNDDQRSTPTHASSIGGSAMPSLFTR